MNKIGFGIGLFAYTIGMLGFSVWMKTPLQDIPYGGWICLMNIILGIGWMVYNNKA